MLKPKLKDYFDVIPESQGRYQMRSSEVTTVIQGATVEQLFGELLPLLDGYHTIDDVVEQLGHVAEPDIVRAVVDKLYESRLIEDNDLEVEHGLSEEEKAKYHRQVLFFEITTNVDKAVALSYQKKIKENRISVIGEGELAVAVALQMAQSGVQRIFGPNLADRHQLSNIESSSDFDVAGIALDELTALENAIKEESPSMLVVALDRPEPDLLNFINDLSQKLNIDLFHCQINGTEGIVGPLVVPGKTACLVCHHLRVTRNFDFYNEYRTWEKWAATNGKQHRCQSAALIPFTNMIAGMACMETIKHASGFYESETYGKFIAINALTLEAIPHLVLRLPRCPSCGNARNNPSFSPWQEFQ